MDSHFIPEGVCGGWPSAPGLRYLHNGSDLAIFAAYLTMAVITVGWLRRRHHDSVRSVFWLWGAYLVACGLTHLMGFLVFYYAWQWADGWVKLVCASISVAAVWLLFRLTPGIMKIGSVREVYERVLVQEIECARLREQVDALQIALKNAQGG